MRGVATFWLRALARRKLPTGVSWDLHILHVLLLPLMGEDGWMDGWRFFMNPDGDESLSSAAVDHQLLVLQTEM